MPETLYEIGKNAETELILVKKVCDVSLYSSVVIVFLIGVFIFITQFVIIPIFETLPLDLAWEYESTTISFYYLFYFIKITLVPQIIFYILIIFWFIFLYSNTLTANRILLRFLNMIPGYRNLFNLLEYSKICKIWSIYIKNNIPDKTTLYFLCDGISSPEIRKDFEQLKDEINQGKTISNALGSKKHIPKLIQLTFRSQKEKDIADELNLLSEMFLDQSKNNFARLTKITEIAAVVFAASLVFLFILGFYLVLYNYLFDTFIL